MRVRSSATLAASLRAPVPGSPAPPASGPRTLDPTCAERFPKLASYLAALPNGIASYPECKVRTGTYDHVLLGDAGARPSMAGVEPAVRDLVLVPSPGLWVPEVNLLAGILAVGDQYRLSPEEHYEWLLERNRQLFRSVVYRAVMAFFTPEMLLRKASERWVSFHQGTEFRTHHISESTTRAELTFPHHLFDAELVRLFGAVFVAAMERANAASVKMVVSEVKPTVGRYDVEWH